MITKPQKYTPQFVLDELNEMLQKLKADKDLIYKGQLFEDRSYSMQRFSEWVNKFSVITDETPLEDRDIYLEISETIGIIETILLNRAVVGGLKNSLNASMTKFHLVNNFGWKDKQDIAHSGAIDTSNEDLKTLAAAATELVKQHASTSA